MNTERSPIFGTRRVITTVTSRRGLLAATSGLLAAGPFARLSSESEAKRRGKHHKSRRKNKNKSNKGKNQKPQTRVDARCEAPIDTAINPSGGDRRIAQTFTALRSGELVSVEISANKLPESEGDFVLRLAPLDGSGLPAANVLAEAVVAEADLPESPATVRFTFPNPFSVVAGTEYALVLTRFGGGGFDWQGNGADPCAGRALFSGSQTEPFAEAGGIDLIFTTFVRS